MSTMARSAESIFISLSPFLFLEVWFVFILSGFVNLTFGTLISAWFCVIVCILDCLRWFSLDVLVCVAVDVWSLNFLIWNHVMNVCYRLAFGDLYLLYYNIIIKFEFWHLVACICNLLMHEWCEQVNWLPSRQVCEYYLFSIYLATWQCAPMEFLLSNEVFPHFFETWKDVLFY